jgi:hypothetical protein
VRLDAVMAGVEATSQGDGSGEVCRTWHTESRRRKWAQQDCEHPPTSAKKTGDSRDGGTPSGTPSTVSGSPVSPTSPTDPDLSRVVAAWPVLPKAIRAGIVAMVQAAGEKPL